jgi:hypothetical protein
MHLDSHRIKVFYLRPKLKITCPEPKHLPLSNVVSVNQASDVFLKGIA